MAALPWHDWASPAKQKGLQKIIVFNDREADTSNGMPWCYRVEIFNHSLPKNDTQNIPRIRPTTEPDKHERQVPGFKKSPWSVLWEMLLGGSVSFGVPRPQNDELLDFKIMNWIIGWGYCTSQPVKFEVYCIKPPPPHASVMGAKIKLRVRTQKPQNRCGPKLKYQNLSKSPCWLFGKSGNLILKLGFVDLASWSVTQFCTSFDWEKELGLTCGTGKLPGFFPVGLQGNQPILSTYEKNRLPTNWGRGHQFFRSQCSIGSTDFLKISCQEVLKSFTSGVHVLFFYSFFTRITMKNCGSYPPKKKHLVNLPYPKSSNPQPCSTTKPCCALAGETGRTAGITKGEGLVAGLKNLPLVAGLIERTAISP